MWNGAVVNGVGTGLRGGEVGFRWSGKEPHRQEWVDSIGRVAADREAGTDHAGHFECRGRGNKLVRIRPEAGAVTLRKSVSSSEELFARFLRK